MGVTSIQTLINGKEVKAPKDWNSNTIQASWGTDSVEPQIETDRFEYVLDGAAAIIEHKEKGNIFEPLPVQQIYTQRDGTFVSMDGYFDVSDDYEELETSWGDVEKPNKVLIKFKQNQSVSNFIDQIQGVSYGSLLEDGIITRHDYTTIKTVIMRRNNFLEVATALLTVYILQKQIIDTIKEIKKTVLEIVSIATGSLTGGLAAAIYTAAVLLLQVAYATSLLALLFTLVSNLLELLIPPVVKNQGIKFKTLLEKACEKFGYVLDTNIEELDIYYYLPSKPYDNESIKPKLIPKNTPTKQGIPSPTDFGYLLNEFFDLIKRMFNTKIAVEGKILRLLNVDDKYWVSQSNFTPHKPIKFDSKTYNTGELSQTRILSFATDLNDEYTTENYTGTSYEIKTQSTFNTVNNSIKGLDKIDIPLCLPNSKTTKNRIETIMIGLANFADELSKIIGKNSNFAKQIENNRINVLKISQNDYGTAKIVPLIKNQLPPNHRDILSAKVLMNKFHYGKSFVVDGQLGQKVIYTDVEIPFVLSDLKETLKNGYFTLQDGRIAQFIDINYNFSKDIAICSFSVNDIYTNKLKEVYYEP